jgi:hypothetical protein
MNGIEGLGNSHPMMKKTLPWKMQPPWKKKDLGRVRFWTPTVAALKGLNKKSWHQSGSCLCSLKESQISPFHSSMTDFDVMIRSHHQVGALGERRLQLTSDYTNH